MSHNILNKVDKSLAPTPAGVSVSKKDKFAWSTGGPQGEFRMVNKHDLQIDGRYQREEVSHRKVLEIAKSWDWLLVGTVSLIERDDGTLWVFDGGHRTRASFYRSDIDFLPCMVHKLENVSDEAKAFVARNTMVSNVSAFARYKASVCAAEPTAKFVSQMLDELGLTVVDGAGGSKTQIMAISAVQKIVAKNSVLARRVIEFCISLQGEKCVPANLLKGLFCLCDRFQGKCDILEEYGDKLAAYGVKGLETKMRQFAAECGKGGEAVYAKALLEIVNSKKRSRLDW